MDFKKINYSKYISRINKEKIPCYEPSVGSNEIKNLKEVIHSGWLSEKSLQENLRILFLNIVIENIH